MLNVLVGEAESLVAKDANGYSDPYCMLGIRPDTAAEYKTQVGWSMLMLGCLEMFGAAHYHATDV